MGENKKKMNFKIIIPVICAIVIIAIIVIVLSQSKMSKSDMQKVAKEITTEEMAKEINENQARAKDKYKNSVYILTGFIQEFEGNNIILYNIDTEYSDSRIRIIARLPKEELKTLDKEQQVKIIGKVSNIEQKKETSTAGGTTFEYNTSIVEMKNAYIEQDIFEYKGVVDIPDKYILTQSYTGKMGSRIRNESEWYCAIGEVDMTEYGETKKFNDDSENSIVAGTEIKDNDIVQMKGKIIYYNARNAQGKATKYKIKNIQDIKVVLESDNK